jgi:hypothetical protein
MMRHIRQSANTSTLQELGRFLETEYLGTRQSAEITKNLFDFADSAGYPRLEERRVGSPSWTHFELSWFNPAVSNRSAE